MSKIEQIAFDIAEPIAAEIGCEVIEAEYVKEGKEYYLRIFLDREEGSVSLDDCEYVSQKFSAEIDKNDPIDGAYYLEVCSPGIDRILKRDKDFVRFTGSEVDVKLYAAKDGRKEFSGILEGYENETAKINVDGSITEVKKSDAVYIRLAVRF